MAHRRRGARSGRRLPVIGPALGLAAALAAALAVALAVAGCTSAPAGTAGGRTASAGTPGQPASTAAQARQVWDRYTAVSGAETGKAGHAALALSLETGAQRAYDAAARAYTASAYTASAYNAPAFYLPEQSGYPRFFVVAVTQQRTSGSSSGTAAPPAADGTDVQPFGPELMLFERASATAPWLLGSTARLAVGEALPKLATDGAGYVPAVRPSAGTLLAKPAEIGALQAAVVDDGPASAATAAVASGQLTTGLYLGARNRADGLTAPRGDVYQWELEGTSYPEFALRTAAGGALVFYTMALDVAVAVPGYIGKADPVRSGPPIQVPGNVRRLLPAGQAAPLIDLQTEQLLSFAAIDPPSAAGKIRVIAIGGGLTSATAS